MSDGGKGDGRRPAAVGWDTWDDNYERTFVPDRLCDAFMHQPNDRNALWLDGEHHTYGTIPSPYVDMLEAMYSDRAYAKGHTREIISVDVGPNMAYMMSTSGSTGEPKHIAISHASALAFVRHMAALLEVGPDSRCSQMHDLGFDFSVHDVWTTWQGGGCLYVVPERERMAPAAFIVEHQLTHFACVPSVAGMMDKLGWLREGAFPSLRHVVFCGEALPVATANAMQRAAPNATVWNMYGPTEATVGITIYGWDGDEGRCRNGLVPIGWQFPGHEVGVTHDGELLLAGPQVADGYWNNPKATAERFKDGWYHTGDLVEMDTDGCLHYIGRNDSQVQVRGHRVELGAVEAVLREVTGTDECACVWNGEVLIAVVVDDVTTDITGRCADLLPDYMVPHIIVRVDRLPRNANGKIDRKALI